MQEVADIVTQSFDHNILEMNSQRVSNKETERCRKQYLHAIRNNDALESFLLKQSIHLQKKLDQIELSPIQTKIAYYKQTDKENIFSETIHFKQCFKTLGRCGTIRVPTCAINVSRIHAMIFHLKHDDGRGLYVILDFWSKGGTVIAGTSHASLPNERRVLVVPDNEPVMLHLGILLDEPFQFILNGKE